MIEDDGAALPMEVSDERFTAWMRGHLLRAAHHFGLTLTADPVFGWRLRSIGAPVMTLQGQRWLRVVSDYPQWAIGDGWTGNSDANTLTGLVLQGQMYGRASLTCDDASPVFPATRHFSSI